MKPPSSWRRGESQKPEARQGRFQQDAHPEVKPRSNSLNPQIYPSWWGEDSDFEKEIKKDRSNRNLRNKER